MNLQRIICWVGGAAVVSAATNALATVEPVETSTKTKGVTTITWESSFHDTAYNLGDTVSFTVNWSVDAGAAEYANHFLVRKITPRSRRDPAEGWMGTVTQDGNSVNVEFTFTALHLDRDRGVEIGKAHLKLYLMIDTDGDGVLDARAGYGVNLRVEDWQSEMGLAATAAPTADIDPVERSTKTKGVTRITWDSSFHDNAYTLNDTVTFNVTWDVELLAPGTAYPQFHSFSVRHFTPKSRRDRVYGTVSSGSAVGDSVPVEASFSQLHLDRDRGVEIGKAHLKLYLMIDTDGDGVLDARAGYGVNLRVEDWQ